MCVCIYASTNNYHELGPVVITLRLWTQLFKNVHFMKINFDTKKSHVGVFVTPVAIQTATTMTKSSDKPALFLGARFPPTSVAVISGSVTRPGEGSENLWSADASDKNTST